MFKEDGAETEKEFSPHSGYFKRGGNGSKEAPFLSPHATDIDYTLERLKELMLITGQPAWFHHNGVNAKVGVDNELKIILLEMEPDGEPGMDTNLTKTDMRRAVDRTNKVDEVSSENESSSIGWRRFLPKSWRI